MIVLAVKFPVKHGDEFEPRLFVFKTISQAQRFRAENFPFLDWRLHDGSGWADGSQDAWTWIVDINGREATLHPYR